MRACKEISCCRVTEKGLCFSFQSTGNKCLKWNHCNLNFCQPTEVLVSLVPHTPDCVSLLSSSTCSVLLQLSLTEIQRLKTYPRKTEERQGFRLAEQPQTYQCRNGRAGLLCRCSRKKKKMSENMNALHFHEIFAHESYQPQVNEEGLGAASDLLRVGVGSKAQGCAACLGSVQAVGTELGTDPGFSRSPSPCLTAVKR